MRSLVIIVFLISVLVMASTAVLYLQTRRTAREVILSRALDRANTFALAARTTNVDDGVLDHLTRDMIDHTVLFACVYAPDGARFCTHAGPKIEPGREMTKIEEVKKSGSFVYEMRSNGQRGDVFELWFPLHIGGGSKGNFGPGPRGQSLRILRLELDTSSTDQLVTRSLIHTILITLLLALLMGLTIRQFRLLLRDQELEKNLMEQKRFAELGRLSAVLAHEIRNPLGAIKGFAQYSMEDLPEDDPRRLDMETIVTESARLERLVRSLLLYAKPAELRLAEHDLGSVVSNAVKLARHDAAQKKIELKVSLLEAPVKARLDEEQMTQAMLNILGNAIDAIENSGKIEVALNQDEHNIQIVVADTGAGIDPELLDTVFEPYVTSKASGTGLGLPVSMKIVKAHGGEIVVDTKPGGGAVITIVLPRHIGGKVGRG